MITYEEYSGLGYSKVASGVFPRYAAYAENLAVVLTQHRLNKVQLTERHKRGLCELIDVHYDTIDKAGIKSFQNGEYSETYDEKAGKGNRIMEIMVLYFEPDLVWRGTP
jgi:hypothetical protein